MRCGLGFPWWPPDGKQVACSLPRRRPKVVEADRSPGEQKPVDLAPYEDSHNAGAAYIASRFGAVLSVGLRDHFTPTRTFTPAPPCNRWLVEGSTTMGSSRRTTVATELNAVPLK